MNLESNLYGLVDSNNSFILMVAPKLFPIVNHRKMHSGESSLQSAFLLFFLLSVGRFLLSGGFDHESESLVGIWNPIFRERPGSP